MGILSSLSEGDFEHPGLPQGVMIDSACETGDTAVMAVFPKFKCIALCGIVREADPVRGLKRVEVRSGAVVVVDAVRKVSWRITISEEDSIWVPSGYLRPYKRERNEPGPSLSWYGFDPDRRAISGDRLAAIEAIEQLQWNWGDFGFHGGFLEIGLMEGEGYDLGKLPMIINTWPVKYTTLL